MQVDERDDGVDEDKVGVLRIKTAQQCQDLSRSTICFPDSTKGSGCPTHQQL